MKFWTILLIIVFIAIDIWFYVAAPCSDMQWMPAKEIPGRCLVLKQ